MFDKGKIIKIIFYMFVDNVGEIPMSVKYGSPFKIDTIAKKNNY